MNSQSKPVLSDAEESKIENLKSEDSAEPARAGRQGHQMKTAALRILSAVEKEKS